MQVLFLDWYRTLSCSRFFEHLESSDPALAARLERSMFVDLADLLGPWMRGQLRAEDVVEAVAARCEVDPGRVLQELSTGCRRACFVSPRVADLVQALRRSGRRVVVATDNMDVFARWTVPALGLSELFDDILNSSELGCLKSDTDADGCSRFFGPYLTRLGVPAAEATLVDDAEEATRHCVERLGMRFRPVRAPGDVVTELELALQTRPTDQQYPDRLKTQGR